MSTRTWVLCGLLGALLGVAGCENDGDGKKPAGPQSGSITGSATKGIIQNAVVEISQFSSSGAPVLIGTGSTDADGNYSTSYSGYTGGPVQVCVRARLSTDTPPTPATTIVCDVTDTDGCGDDDQGNPLLLGDTITAPTTFEICTCLPEPPTTGVRAPVTPFTDIVVQRATERNALGENLTQALLNASSEIAQLVGGVDVLRLEPVDLSDPDAVSAATADELTYSALVAAVLAQTAGAGVSAEQAVTDAVSGLLADFENGEVAVQDLYDLVAEAQAQLLGLNESDESGILAFIDELADAADAADGTVDGQGTADTQPAEGADADRITRAKNLVQNVRDTINGLNELQAPADAFGAQVDMAALVLDPDDPAALICNTILCDLFEDLGYILEQASLFVDAQTDLDGNVTDGTTEVGSTQGNSNDDGVAQTATVTIATSGGNRVLTITGTARDTDVNLTLTLTNNPDTTTTNPLTATISGSMVETDGTGPGLQLTISTGTVTLTKTGNVALDDGNPDTDDDVRISSAALSFNSTLQQIRTPAEQEGGALSFNGQLGATVVRCTASSCVSREATDGATFFGSAFNLSGTFSNSLNSTAMSVSASVANPATFDPELEASTSNFPDATVTLQFDADLGEVAPARVVLTGDLNGIFVQPEECCPGETHSDPDATASLSLLRDGTQVFRVQAQTVDSGDDTTVNVTITDSTGAVITFNEAVDDPATTAKEVGEIKVDGVLVGTIQELSTGLVIIRYEDGTFESLFN